VRSGSDDLAWISQIARPAIRIFALLYKQRAGRGCWPRVSGRSLDPEHDPEITCGGGRIQHDPSSHGSDYLHTVKDTVARQPTVVRQSRHTFVRSPSRLRIHSTSQMSSRNNLMQPNHAAATAIKPPLAPKVAHAPPSPLSLVPCTPCTIARVRVIPRIPR